jgi:peptide/nickel transport system permease protein
LLAAEAGKPYARAARSLGFDWPALHGRLLFRNTLLPIAAQIAASFRVIVGELIVIEWLFEWPGIGRLLALALVPARFSTAAGQTTFFLDPPLIAGLCAILAGLFVVVDAAGALAGRWLDPRTQNEAEPS